MRWVLLPLGLLLAAWALGSDDPARRALALRGAVQEGPPPAPGATSRPSAGPDLDGPKLGGHGAQPGSSRETAALPRASLDDPRATPEDPRQPGTTDTAGTPTAKVRRILRMVTPQEGQPFTRREPLPQGSDAARELIAYDVSALLSHGGGCAAPVKGCEEVYTAETSRFPPLPRPDDAKSAVRLGHHAFAYEPGAGQYRGGLELLEALLTATGTRSWIAENTWLGFDQERGLLWIRTAPRVAAIVEQVLDRWAAQAASVWRIHAWIGGAGMAEQGLDLDVLWAGTARALAGTRSTYLMDYDIEIFGGSTVATPIWGIFEKGLGLRALHLEPVGRGPGQIVLDLFDALGTPVSRSLTFPSGFFLFPERSFASVTVEDLTLTSQHQQAALPADEDAQVVFDLSDGRRCTIEVRRLGTAITPWRRVRTPRAARAALPRYTFALHGSRSGHLGQDDTSLGRGRGQGYARLRTDSPAWLRKRRSIRDQTDVPPDFFLDRIRCGAIKVDITAWDNAYAPSRLDLVLDLEGWPGESRTLHRRCGDHGGGSGWTESVLPTADALVLTRRLYLDRAGTGTTTFRGDLGRGPEQFTLRVFRRDG